MQIRNQDGSVSRLDTVPSSPELLVDGLGRMMKDAGDVPKPKPILNGN